MTDFLLEVVGSAASLDVERFKDLFSYCPEDYVLGTDNSGACVCSPMCLWAAGGVL